MNEGLVKKRFVSGHRFSDASTRPPTIAPLLAGRRNRSALALLLLALLLSPCAVAESAAEVYKLHCSACHGRHGDADTMIGKNLRLRPLYSSEVQSQSDDQLFHVIAKGKNKMPAFDKKLSKDEIRELANYVRSLKR